ncbi:hypothetical protein BKA83DRAFT_1528277 [Pisolithus microcarpus]|nr:hypothetical protein BKA83DRAFT_1528277 [Pisolithus microcarpus]
MVWPLRPCVPVSGWSALSIWVPRMHGDKPLNVFRMKMLGAKSGSKRLKDAVDEVMRDWIMNLATMHFLIGSCFGPHPFLAIVRDYQNVIGHEQWDRWRRPANSWMWSPHALEVAAMPLGPFMIPSRTYLCIS